MKFVYEFVFKRPQGAEDLFAKRPAFMKWWQTVSARPSWQKVSGKAAA